jgi:membrane protein
MTLASLCDSLRDAGRDARTRLPRWMLIPGWAARDFLIDEGLHWSASIAFYGVLSIFPLVLAGVDIASWFTNPQGASQQASQILQHVMPHADAVRDIIDKAVATRHRTGLIALLFLLYAGGRVFAVLIRTLNIACDLNETYGFFQGLLVEVGMLLSIGLLFLAALVSNFLAPAVGDLFASIPQERSIIVALISWTLPSVLLLGGYLCLYKFVPRHRCNWQSSLLGALAATAGCDVARPLFTVYVSKLASYSQIYGWLTIGILFMIWAQVIAIITIYCGELASHIQMIVYDGISGEEVSRRHRLRSPGRNIDREEKGHPSGSDENTKS